MAQVAGAARQRPGGLWVGIRGECPVRSRVESALLGRTLERPGVEGFGRAWVLLELTQEALKGVSRK